MAAVASKSVSRVARATALLHQVEALIPKLSQQSHKGQHGMRSACFLVFPRCLPYLWSGRIAVVGGCLEYCGAPFYAASAALKCVRTCLGCGR